MAGKGIFGKIGAYFSGFGKVGIEDEKVYLALRIAERLSIADLRKLAEGPYHVHRSPGKRKKVEVCSLSATSDGKINAQWDTVSEKKWNSPDYGV